jgi:hypothetical protein
MLISTPPNNERLVSRAEGCASITKAAAFHRKPSISALPLDAAN